MNEAQRTERETRECLARIRGQTKLAESVLTRLSDDRVGLLDEIRGQSRAMATMRRWEGISISLALTRLATEKLTFCPCLRSDEERKRIDNQYRTLVEEVLMYCSRNEGEFKLCLRKKVSPPGMVGAVSAGCNETPDAVTDHIHIPVPMSLVRTVNDFYKMFSMVLSQWRLPLNFGIQISSDLFDQVEKVQFSRYGIAPNGQFYERELVLDPELYALLILLNVEIFSVPNHSFSLYDNHYQEIQVV